MNRIRNRSSADPPRPLPSFAPALVLPIRLSVSILVAALLLPTAASAQEPPEIPPPGTTIYDVELADGSLVRARITEVSEERVVFTTLGGGRLEIDPAQILAIAPATGRFVRGEYWHEDPGGTRLFFTSTGRSLDAGESYLGTYVVFLPFAAIGVTDRFTVAAGAPVLFGEVEPFYVGPKLQVLRRPEVQASVGTLAFFFDDDMIGVAYGVGTFGNRDNAFSAGLGFFYSGDDVLNEPAFMFGGETRIGRTIKLISENYVLPDAVGFVWSGGTRIIGDRFNTEVGVMGVAAGDEAFCCLPLVNFTYGFGR